MVSFSEQDNSINDPFLDFLVMIDIALVGNVGVGCHYRLIAGIAFAALN